MSLAETDTERETESESQKFLAIEDELNNDLNSLEFQPPIMFVYKPLEYAKVLHEAFIRKYFETSTKKILFLGINPGPWGMCQTGIFFGERDFVIKWFNITGSVERPEKEHPKRAVRGLKCHRREQSGKRLWGFFKELCGTPENFFKHSFVHNLCPLAFLAESGKNITPKEIKDKTQRKRLIDICNAAFIDIIRKFKFETVISIGGFATENALSALRSNGLNEVKVCKIPHPSNRNPQSRRDWEKQTFAVLKSHDLVKYFNEDPEFDDSVFGAQ